MSVQRFKIALNNARYPLVSTKAQRAAFIPGLDAAPRTPRVFMGADESADYNMAQVIYAENVMPAAEGIKSVGYRQLIAPTVLTDFDSIFALRDADENTVLYSPSKGENRIYDDTAGAWAATDIETVFALTLDAGSLPAASRVTYAYVDGKTFVCFSRLKSDDGVPVDMSIMFWNGTALVPAGALIADLPFGAGEVDGIAASNGYLIVWSALSVAWAPFNGTAFNYTIYANGNLTGAGQQTPEEVQGNVRAIIPVSGGFIIFTDKNAVGATYSQQTIAQPWIFREVAGAGGLESYEQATVEGTLGVVYAYTTAGFQRLSLNSAEVVWPDAGDFVAGREIERFLFGENTLYQGSTTLDFYLKLTNIANRYIVVSYGTFPGIYSFALVYDLALQRWGKLRMVHRDCFYYAYGVETASLTYSMLGDVPYDHPDLGTYADTTGQSNAFTAAQHGLAFLREDGSVVIANWSNQVRDTQDEAVAIIGRVQLSRSNNTQLNRVEIEGLRNGAAFIQPSYDGGALNTAEALYDLGVSGNTARYGCLIDCLNFNLVVTGTFDLSTTILEALPSGKF